MSRGDAFAVHDPARKKSHTACASHTSRPLCLVADHLELSLLPAHTGKNQTNSFHIIRTQFPLFNTTVPYTSSLQLLHNIRLHPLLPELHQTPSPEPPILLLDLIAHTNRDVIFLALQNIGEFLERNARLSLHHVIVDRVAFEEIIRRVERVALHRGAVVMPRRPNDTFHRRRLASFTRRIRCVYSSCRERGRRQGDGDGRRGYSTLRGVGGVEDSEDGAIRFPRIIFDVVL